MSRDPASFRDPSGHVYLLNGRVLRTVLAPGVEHYLATRDSGFIEAATERGMLIAGSEADPQLLRGEVSDAPYVLEHPRLPFISYPYEWSFYGLRDAALLTLDLHQLALEYGLTLSDSTAYNVQFTGPKAVFIDYLSFLKYEEGQVWIGYRQFCEQFLNPLLLTAKTGLSFQPTYRGMMEGLPSTDIAAVMPFRAKLDPRVALHVVLQGRLHRKASASHTSFAKTVRLSKSALTNNLASLRSWIAGLTPPQSQRSPWQHYEQTANYTAEERAGKARFVSEFIAGAAPSLVWDLGCNSGEYSEIAVTSGAASVIGFEPDPGAVNAAFLRAKSKRLPFLPLALDLTNPSPSQGWRQQERKGLAERRNADVVLCLALLHHLVLGRNVPVTDVLDWLVSLAPKGVIEFVPRDDPMARQLAAWKPALAPDYTLDDVRAILGRRAQVVREAVVTGSGRTLLAFSRS